MTSAKLSNRLTTQDATFLYAESESTPLHFSGLATFEGSLDYTKLTDYMERRLPRLPRFRQRLVPAPLNIAHPALEDDLDFKITNHLFHHELPAGSNQQALEAAALRIFEPLMDRNRPLWEMHLLTGLENNRSAVLWKIHHCIVDGVSWVENLNVMLESHCEAPVPEPAKTVQAKPLPNMARGLADAVNDLMSAQLRAVRRLMKPVGRPLIRSSSSAALVEATRAILRPTIVASWNEGIVTKSRVMAWLRFPFNDVGSIRQAYGGTVNDIALTALGEGAARYLRHHKRSGRRLRLRIGCPVSVRGADELGTLGNRVSMMIPELDAAPMDPVKRLKAVCSETQRLKASNQAKAADYLMNGVELIPPAALGLGYSIVTRGLDAAAALATRAPMISKFFAPRIAAFNFIATNVAGPGGPVYLAGHRMLDYVGMIPLGANLGYGVVIATYNQNLYFGMMAATDLMPDVETMKFYVGQVFEELALSAKSHLGPSTASAESAAHREAA